MMSNGVSLEQKPFELFTKWSEGHLDMLNQRQQMFKQATESFLGVVRDSVERKAPEESLQKLCGSMLGLCSLPSNTLGDNVQPEEYSREFLDFAARTPFALTGNGISAEIRHYGKETWKNGSRASSACMSWMKSLLREHKIASDGKEAEQVVKNCLEATESFIEESVACWMDQVKAGSGLVRHGLLKERGPGRAGSVTSRSQRTGSFATHDSTSLRGWRMTLFHHLQGLSGLSPDPRHARLFLHLGQAGASDPGMRVSAMTPAVDDQPLEPHEGAQMDDQGHPGKSVRDEDGHAVYLLLPVLVRVVRLSHPDGGLGLIGNAAIPHHDIVQEHRSAVFKGVGCSLGAQGQHVFYLQVRLK